MFASIKHPLALAALSVIAVSAQAAAPSLITNGSFETGTMATGQGIYTGAGYCYVPDASGCATDGWTGNFVRIEATSGPWGTPSSLVGFDASFGSIVTGLQGTQSFSTTFNVSTSGSYTLTWFDAGRSNHGVGQNYLLNLDGTPVNLGFGVPFGQAWTSRSLTFNGLQSGTHTLNFQGLQQADGTAFIDKVSLTQNVTAVPEPTSVAMLLAGLAVVGGMNRRKQRATT